MFFCSADVLKKSSKKNEKRIKRKQLRCYNNLVTVERDGEDESLPLTSDFLARITMTLISSFAITGRFHKVNFLGFNLVILTFELAFAFFFVLYDLFEK